MLLMLCASFTGMAQTPTSISVLHRSGQTFVTWVDRVDVSGAFYRVYRSAQPISTATLQQAEHIATLPSGSAEYRTERWKMEMGFDVLQRNFVITHFGPELDDGQGLLVYTTQPGEQGPAFYAVTSVVSDTENTTIASGVNALVNAIEEQPADPDPVCVWRSGNNHGRVYTQFMDFKQWNPTFDGYAYNYFVSVPENYTPTLSWPLYLHLEGWGSRYSAEDSTGTPWDVGAIQIWADEPHQSWYYGFSASHDYGDDWPQNIHAATSVPLTGPIVNFAEERLLRSIYDIIRDPRYTVDTNRIYVYGHSMGGSGALALAMRYPNVFAAAICSQPMTHYGGDNANVGGNWIADAEQKFGTLADNLPIENRGRYAEHLRKYDGTGVWDWMNHQLNMQTRMGDEMAYIQTSHGTLDDVIEWDTQGRPWNELMSEQARRAWQGMAIEIDHTWVGFFDTPVFHFGEFSFRKDRSFPAVTSSSLNLQQDNRLSYYNFGIEWSCPWNDFAGDIVDEAQRYEITLRIFDPGFESYQTLPETGTVNITPRRLQRFVVEQGKSYHWENVPMSGGASVQEGVVVADEHALIMLENVRITKSGNRIIVTPRDIHSLPEDGVPERFFVSCHPNPFTDATTISLDGCEAVPLMLRIHDVLGRCVHERNVYSEGSRRISSVWNGVDASGVACGTGVYYVVVYAPHSTPRVLPLVKL